MTLQEHYLLLKEGKGHKDSFMKSARNLFPEYISSFTPYNEAVNILKNKSILSENISGIAIDKQQDWVSIFKENMVAEAKELKKPSKEVKDSLNHAYDEKDTKNIDNLYGQEFLVGYYAEMKDPKNESKTVAQLKSIVAKNLAKDPSFYVKDGQFGVKGLGYSVNHPGLGEPKPATGKYKSSGYGNLKESINDELEEMIQFRPQKGGGGKRFIPKFFDLSKDAVSKYPGLIKMINSPSGVEMYISTKLPPIFTAIHRGRQDINSLPPLLKKLQDFLPREIINLMKNHIDNKTVEVNGEPMHKINLTIYKNGSGNYQIMNPFEGKDDLNEENNELMAAKERARISSEEGYVQHVNKTEYGYEVSDWYDSDTTVCSYENGEKIGGSDDYENDLDNYDDNMYNQSYQFDDENPDLRDLGADPKLYESKLRSVISQLIKEELNMAEIESCGEDAKKKAMNKKIDEELSKRKRKLKALTTLTELEEDAVNPLKLKELQADIKKLEATKKKMNKVRGGKKKAAKQEEEITDAVDPQLKDIETKKAELEKREASILNKPGVQSA